MSVRGKEENTSYDGIEDGVVLLVDGPDETTANASGGVDCGVDVLLRVMLSNRNKPCCRRYRWKDYRASFPSLWGSTVNRASA